MFTRNARRNFDNYVRRPNMVALPLKAANKTVYMLFTSEQMIELRKLDETAKGFREDGNALRWKGLQVMHFPMREAKRIRDFEISCKWNEFKEEGGNMSRAQEEAVCEALNSVGFNGETWTVVSRNANKKGQYNPDILGSNGTKIEVKGFDSTLVTHFNDGHGNDNDDE